MATSAAKPSPKKASSHIKRSDPASLPAQADTKSDGKRDVSKLQKAIVDGLEDVKAQNLMVFDTEHLSSLFERVIVASGTSNRQTKALAMSVRDAVREAGFPKPRTEGEDNGEWIIVDCGPAVVHIMQPAIRQYYHLEDIWGEKPVRLKHAAAAKAQDPAQVRAKALVAKEKADPALKKSAQGATKSGAGKRAAAAGAQTAPAKKVTAKKAVKTSPQAVAKKTAAKKVAAKSAPAKKAAAKKSP